MRTLGSILLCLSVAGIGYIFKNDALLKSEIISSMETHLKRYKFNLEEVYLKKIFNILTSLVLFSGLAFLPQFEFTATLGGISLAICSFLLHFDGTYILKSEFVMYLLIALCLVLVGIQTKKN